MLTVFVDDSGTDQQSPFCALAGYVSTSSRWELFSKEWDAALTAQPSISYLKMRDAEGLRGEFGGWNRQECDEKLVSLALIIKTHVIGGIGSFVSNKAYKSIVEGCLPSTVDHPYWLCFQRVVLGVMHLYGQESRGEKIDFVFDTQGIGYERRAMFMHNQWAELLGPVAGGLIGTISFGNDRLTPPLQAADMLAWHMRRHADDAILRRAKHRPAADVLWSINTPTRAWEPEHMADFVDFYNANHPESPVNRPDLHVPPRSNHDDAEDELPELHSVTHRRNRF